MVQNGIENENGDHESGTAGKQGKFIEPDVFRPVPAPAEQEVHEKNGQNDCTEPVACALEVRRTQCDVRDNGQG